MLQQILIGLIVSTALFFVARRAWRSLAGAKQSKDGCGTGCKH